jgi:hypothetical protein
MASRTLAAVLKPSLYWFLAFIPISIYLEHFQDQAHLWIFFASCLAIIPLAGLLGEATDEACSPCRPSLENGCPKESINRSEEGGRDASVLAANQGSGQRRGGTATWLGNIVTHSSATDPPRPMTQGDTGIP